MTSTYPSLVWSVAEEMRGFGFGLPPLPAAPSCACWPAPVRVVRVYM